VITQEEIDDVRDEVVEDHEQSLTARIEELEQHWDSQPHEVAAKFLHEARSLWRLGKFELSNRKKFAADRVLDGVSDE
jgi:hypothetical protein